MILWLTVFFLLHTGRPDGRLVSAPLPASEVRQVMPATGEVHENLLRFSIRFSHPPDQQIFSNLKIVRSDGTALDEPFLNQELWSPDGKTLTVLFGPGRVKTGLIAHDTMGRPLHAGEQVELQLCTVSLAHWMVTPEWIRPINPKEWRIGAPLAGTKGSLRLRFSQPIDGMDANLILVTRNGKPLQGAVVLNGDQTQWSFHPTTEWRKGHYTILVHPHLEDPYGNEIGSAFETPERNAAHSETRPVVIPFELRLALTSSL